MTNTVTKAVFPVAGMGTRFLPATKANPKEMLPIVDKPLIQYAAEEAAEAGITELIFITGRSKRAIEDHFDGAAELEMELERRGKDDLLSIVKGILPRGVNCIYIRQAEPLGLGHAVLCAKPVVGNSPFAVLLADDLIDGGERGCTRQMVDVFDYQRCSVLAVQDVPREDTGKYGIVSTEGEDGNVVRVTSIVEKPEPANAPSTLAVVGRYVLTPAIFGELERTRRGAGGEIQLTDAISALLSRERVTGLRFAGKRYDCGSKTGYLEANVEYALKHPELKDEFSDYLRALAARL